MFKLILFTAALGACQAVDQPPIAHVSLADAMAQLPNATILRSNADGTPRWITGELGTIAPLPDDAAAADLQLRSALDKVVAPFSLTASELALQRMSTDDRGRRHVHYRQTHDGLDVLGGDLIVHVGAQGTIEGVNGTARGDLPAIPDAPIGEARALSIVDQATGSPRLVYVLGKDHVFHVAYEVQATAKLVYVDAGTGAIVRTNEQVRSAKNRKIYSANNTDNLPGTKMRFEGDPTSADPIVNTAYADTGIVYDIYYFAWLLDSWNNDGDPITTSVHWGDNNNPTCNAEFAWSTFGNDHIAFGGGSGACHDMTRLDIVGHEFTHGVTHHTSDLDSGGESGGMDEAISDIMGNWIESFWYGEGQGLGVLRDNAKTYREGEEAFDTSYIRNMCNPQLERNSAGTYSYCTDHTNHACPYSQLQNSIDDAGEDVHHVAGIGDLAICLIARGGPHPQGLFPVTSPGVGYEMAANLTYQADRDYLSSDSDYLDWRTGMEQASTGWIANVKTAVGCGWFAVGVGGRPAEGCARGDIPLRNAAGAVTANYANLNHTVTNVSLGSEATNWTIAGKGDFDSDGIDDLLWRDSVTGNLKIWAMRYQAILQKIDLPGRTTDYKLKGVGSFFGGQKKDILWEQCNTGTDCGGPMSIWIINNNQFLASQILAEAPVSSTLIAIADFDNDGFDDLLFRNTTTGQLTFWYLKSENGNAVTVHPVTFGMAFDVANHEFLGVGDFFRDGFPDILWRDPNGYVFVWKMLGLNNTPSYGGAALVSNTKDAFRGIIDFDGNGTSDILWQSKVGSALTVWDMNGADLKGTWPAGAATGVTVGPLGYFDD
ncbi:MAG: M4 family metallopeptidase [Kofleriaceae bacterium]